jgi:hypothetical protein
VKRIISLLDCAANVPEMTAVRRLQRLSGQKRRRVRTSVKDVLIK